MSSGRRRSAASKAGIALVASPDLDQRQPKIVVRIGIVGLQLHHLPKCRHRRLRVARALQQQAELGLRLGEIRLQLHRSLEFLDRLLALRRVFERAPEIVMRLGALRESLDRTVAAERRASSIFFCCQRTTPRCKAA